MKTIIMLQTLQVIYLQCLVYVSPVISEKMVEMIKTNSGSKSVQVFNVCLYLHCHWRSNYNEGNPFCEVNDLRCEVVVRFANIEGIVYHHCLKLLFIEMAIPQKFQWAKQFYIHTQTGILKIIYLLINIFGLFFHMFHQLLITFLVEEENQFCPTPGEHAMCYSW